jgi:cell wall-associated NlpC family hydrolase
MRHTTVCHMMKVVVSRVIVCAGALLAPAVALAQDVESIPPAIEVPEDSTRRQAPFAAFSASALSLRDSLVALARKQVGRRYLFGGETPERGFDCSGLVKYLTAALDMKLPRTAAQQASAGSKVPKDTASLQPGDLLLFGGPKRISHIGIYIGEGRFIHASSTAGRVIESALLRPPARRIKPWRGVRRVVADSLVVTPAGTGPA